jgi:flagellar motor switch protein FliG
MDRYQKGALLIYAIGEDAAVALMERLDPRQVQKLGVAIAAIKNVDPEEVKSVLAEFRDAVGEKAVMGASTEKYLKNVLVRMLGEARAKPVLSRILGKYESDGIRGLKWMDSPTIAENLKNEHAQVIAAVVTSLDRDQATEVLGEFTERTRHEVVLRVALLDSLQPEAASDLNELMGRLVNASVAGKTSTNGGVRAAAELLNGMSGGEDVRIIEKIKDYDAELASRVQAAMFTFDDLISVDQRGMQALVRNLDQNLLIAALKGAKPEMKEKIFGAMSGRQADLIRDELSTSAPMRLSDIETAQKDIVKVARTMADNNEIMLGAGEEMV